MKVLANDGLDQSGIEKLQQEGFRVITDKVPQEELIDYINENQIRTLLVRSATKVRKDIVDYRNFILGYQYHRVILKREYSSGSAFLSSLMLATEKSTSRSWTTLPSLISIVCLTPLSPL